MKANITALAALAILGCGATLAASPATAAASPSASACNSMADRNGLTGAPHSQYVEHCRKGASRALLAMNEQRHADDADLGG